MTREQSRARGAGSRSRLSARDWVDAAVKAMGIGGVDAVAVEPLAKQLGATKGSFYWHFANREALLDAALTRWEEMNTAEVISSVDPEPDPVLRLRNLFKTVPGAVSGDVVEASLLRSANHPQVQPFLQRVTERRVGYLASLFSELGYSEEESQHMALLAYSVYVGHTYLAATIPDLLPDSVEDRKMYLQTMVRAFTRG